MIYNSQDMEAAQMSIKRGMDKENVVYTHTHTHNGMLISHNKERKKHTTKKKTIPSAAT